MNTPGGIEPRFIQFFVACHKLSMLDWQRMYALYNSVRYVIQNDIPGDLVECGVWKGGACMMMAMILQAEGDADRRIHLYDTFAGMTEPTEHDRSFDDKTIAHHQWAQQQRQTHNDWCYAGVQEVRANLLSTGFPPDRLVFIQGTVEKTIPASAPQRISLLRLDTDWYESTLHELVHLYPLVSDGGVVIFDDYSFWQGQKKAADQYFHLQNVRPLLLRDSIGATMIKQPARPATTASSADARSAEALRVA